MTKPEDKIPKWLLEQEGLNTREFKEWKRADLFDVEVAVSELGYCSGYLPKDAYLNYLQINQLVILLRQQLSQREWGR